MLHAPISKPLRPLCPIQLLVSARCRFFSRAAIMTAPRRGRRQTGLTMPLGNPAFSPVNSQSPAHVPSQGVCLDCQISRIVRYTSTAQSKPFPRGPPSSSESCPLMLESGRLNRSVCCPPRPRQEVCARFPGRRTRPQSPAVRKNLPCRFHPHQSVVGTFPANALLRSPALLRQVSSAPAQTARIPQLLFLGPALLVLSRKPPRSICSSAQRKSSIPSAQT